MEKIIVKPESVRCLGNIVIPKTLSDWNTTIGTLTYDDSVSVNGVYGAYTLGGS